MTALDIVTDALRELLILNATDAASGEDAAFALFRLNKLLDRWNAERRAVYASALNTYTLTPALSPHTIGPTGATWTYATARPEDIEAANLILSDGSRTPIAIRDQAWRMGLSLPTLSQDIPTDLSYEPAWPNGKIWFYGVPASAYQVELLLRVTLGALTLASDFTLPPGYQDAITKTLAEDLASPFGVEMPRQLPAQADAARLVIWGNHSTVPRMTSDLPGSGRTAWDYQTGTYR